MSVGQGDRSQEIKQDYLHNDLKISPQIDQ